MIFWYETDSGKIRQASQGVITPAHHGIFPEGSGVAVIELDADASVIDTHYISNGVLIEKPTRPSGRHFFDYTTKQWVDARTLDTLREEAYVRIQKWRDAQEAATLTFEHAGRRWDGGLVTRQRLQPVLSLQALPDGFFWTDAENVDVSMTVEHLRQLGAAHEQALVLRGFEIHARQRAMKAELPDMSREQLLDLVPDWASPVLIPDPAEAG